MSEVETDYARYLPAAREIAMAGGARTLDFFRSNVRVERKADASPVTVADRETEQLLRREIHKRFPDHAVVGEEFGGTLGSNEWEWIVDPIDGTKSFIRGVPLYTTLLALVHRGRPVLGVIYAPATGEIVSAALGTGTTDETGTVVSVSTCSTVTDAWFLTTDPHDFAKREPELFRTLNDRCAATRTWADAYGYLLLARGAVDLMIDPIMSPWDIAPLSVIVREAGGTFTDLAGAANDLGDSALAAATPELHAEVTALPRHT
ncbi:MAG: hypothetical protein PF508_13345 [Spirochaeta sp.]|nr:hypothetical protein [Spirochaeta sp.]